MALLPVAFWPLLQTGLANVSIEGCFYRKVVPDSTPPAAHVDPGYIEAFLLNEGDKAATISRVQFDGILTASAEDDVPSPGQFYGCMVTPQQLSPGCVSRVVIKLKEPLSENSVLKVTTANDHEVEAQIPPSSPRVITYLAFSDDLDVAYIYLSNRTEGDLALKELAIRQDEKPADTIPLDVALGPGTTRCVTVPLQPSMKMGDHLTVAARGQASVIDEARCRASAEFPMEAESFEGQLLMQCPTHAHGSLEQAMRRLMAFSASADSSDDTSPSHTTLHICRNNPVLGIQLFSSVSERVRFNAFIPVAHGLLGPEMPDSTPACWGALLKAASEPRPFDVVVVASDKPGTQTHQRVELYQGVLDCLAAGAKGFYFRGSTGSAISDLRDSVTAIKPLLRISEPTALHVRSSDESVRCQAHLAGEEGLIIFVLRPRLQDLHALENRVQLIIPGLNMGSAETAVRVDGGSFSSCVINHEDSRIIIDAGKVDIGTIVLVGPEALIEEVQRPASGGR